MYTPNELRIPRILAVGSINYQYNLVDSIPNLRELAFENLAALVFNKIQPITIDRATERLEAAMLNLLPRDYEEPSGKKLLRHFLKHMLY